jgi:hypothetical protein
MHSTCCSGPFQRHTKCCEAHTREHPLPVPTRLVALATLVAAAASCSATGMRLEKFSGVEDPLVCLAVSNAPSDQRRQGDEFRDSLHGQAGRTTELHCEDENCLAEQASKQDCDVAILAILGYFGTPTATPLSRRAARDNGMTCLIEGTTWRINGMAWGRYWSRKAPTVVHSPQRTTYSTSESVYKRSRLYSSSGGFVTAPCGGVPVESDAAAKSKLIDAVPRALARRILLKTPE